MRGRLSGCRTCLNAREIPRQVVGFDERRRPASSSSLGRGSEQVDVDDWKIVWRVLDAIAVVMDLDEFAPVGRRPSRGRHRWWLDRFAHMSEDFSDRAWIADRMSAAAGGLPRVRRPWMVSHSGSSLKAMSRMSPPHMGHAIGNASAIFARSFAHAIREVSWERGLSSASERSVDPWEAPSRWPAPGGPRGRVDVASPRLPTLPMASAVTADLSLWFGANTPW